MPDAPNLFTTLPVALRHYTAYRDTGSEAACRVSLSGRIGKPLITLHGTLDCLLPITVHADRYAAMVRRAGRSDLHRYYVVAGATHVDGLCDQFPDRLRPLLPCHRAAFVALERWVEQGISPPPSRGLPWPPTAGADDCEL